MHTSKIRIIAGIWRSRKIPVPNFVELRPSTDRIRETLFNWLTPYIHQAHCLDLFSGSGILGFESVSRGAKFVTLIDNNPAVIQHLQHQVEILQSNAFEIIKADVIQWLGKATAQTYDIIFIDPPFASQLWPTICELLEKNNWLTENTLIYIEHPADYKLILSPKWQALKQQSAGKVSFGLWQYKTKL